MKIPRFNLFILLIITVSVGMQATNAYAHSGPLNELAIKACVQKQRSKACRYQGVHNDLYIGTCQYMAESLLCVRNQPIQQLDTSNKNTKPDHSHEDTQR